MASIRPFCAIRPAEREAAKVICAPYDVVTTEEARTRASGNPYSFYRVVRSEIDFSPDLDPYSPRVYDRAKENLAQLLSEGVLIAEQSPGMYIYRQRMGSHTQTGLVATVSLEEYSRGDIRIHEFTRHEKESDRIRHILTTGVQAEPVFLTYRAQGEITALMEKIVASSDPIYDLTTDDEVRHSVWTVSDTKQFEHTFESVRRLYIADGHHRSAAAAKVRDEVEGALDQPSDLDAGHRWMLATIFPDDQLQILPYHRLILDEGKDSNSHRKSDEEILQQLGRSFSVSETNFGQVSRRGEFTLYLSGFWYLLEWNGKLSGDPIADLDVSIFQREVLEPVFGITDPRTDKRIDFVGGIRGTSELERRVNNGTARAAFALCPVQIEDLLDIADANGVMPPKSTWFEPKPRSGLFVYPYAGLTPDKSSVGKSEIDRTE